MVGAGTVDETVRRPRPQGHADEDRLKMIKRLFYSLAVGLGARTLRISAVRYKNYFTESKTLARVSGLILHRIDS
jgi:hypothetical protein